MSGELYSNRILELSTDIKYVGETISKNFENIGHSLKISKICGSKIELSLALDDKKEKIIAFSIVPNACALGQASAAILSHNIIGASIEEVQKARDDLFEMLKNDGPMPQGRFWELRYLEGVKDYRPRHTSTLLAWDAAVSAINEAIKD